MEEIDQEQPEEIIHKFLEDQLQGIDVDQIVQFQLDKLNAEYYQTQVQKNLAAQEEIKEEKDQQQSENEIEKNQSFNEAYQDFDNVEYQAINYEMLDSDSEEEQKQNKEENPQLQSQEENNQQNSFDFEEFSPQQQNQQSDGVFECVPQFKENYQEIRSNSIQMNENKKTLIKNCMAKIQINIEKNRQFCDANISKILAKLK